MQTEFKRGDEVRHKSNGKLFVVTNVSDIVLEDGLIWCSLMDISSGRTFSEIDSLLEKTGNRYEIKLIKEETNG